MSLFFNIFRPRRASLSLQHLDASLRRDLGLPQIDMPRERWEFPHLWRQS